MVDKCVMVGNDKSWLRQGKKEHGKRELYC